jgi:hypothetical protein
LIIAERDVGGLGERRHAEERHPGLGLQADRSQLPFRSADPPPGLEFVTGGHDHS